MTGCGQIILTKGNLPMSRRLVHAAAVLALLASAGALSACNTVAGAGQDVSSAGHAVTGTADKTKSSM
jgi:predicted small secreted protein